jgi:hypothetical protein
VVACVMALFMPDVVNCVHSSPGFILRSTLYGTFQIL